MNAQKTRKITPAEERRRAEFDRMREDMTKDGYTEESLCVSAQRANVMALAISAPIVIVLWVLYLLARPGLGGFFNFPYGGLVFLLAFIAAVVVHELIHGLTWSLFCVKKWRAISFGMIWKYFMPYCSCGECLPFWPYFAGVVMPTVVLGFLPYAVSLIIGSYSLMMFSLLMIFAGGGDLYILRLIRKKKSALFIDHPYEVGCVAFFK